MEESRRLNRAAWAAYGTLAVCLVAYLALGIVRRGGQSSTLVDGWGVAGFEIIASALCIGRALATGADRRVPLVLGVGLLSWSI